MRCHINHADTHDRVVTHRYRQWNDDNDKRYTFLTHTKDSAEETEEQHYQSDDNIINAKCLKEFYVFQFSSES